MPNGPDLPTIDLHRGPWRARIWDPRPDPLALGARYVHGGYVAELLHHDRVLSARPQEAWDPYVGQGLPEVFEMPLGFAAAAEGEPFLRIGAGRMRRRGRDWPQAGALDGPVTWQLLEQHATSCLWRCRDALALDDRRFAYQLTRQVMLDEEEGLVSRTSLQLECPWSEALIWFAHPFFACSSGDAIACSLPTGARVGDALQADEQGLFRLPAGGGFTAVTGVQGQAADLDLELDPALGGCRLTISGDFLLDKLVIYGTSRAFSIEPYLCRAMQDGEVLDWSLAYGLE